MELGPEISRRPPHAGIGGDGQREPQATMKGRRPTCCRAPIHYREGRTATSPRRKRRRRRWQRTGGGRRRWQPEQRRSRACLSP